MRRPTLTFEQCARTGVTAAQYGHIEENPAAQYNGFVGGNPDLQPETADTLSFGLAFQPSFLPGLRLQIDYFDISDRGRDPGAERRLLAADVRAQRRSVDVRRACIAIATARCGNSNDGFIVDTFENIGEIATSGIDFDASYAVRYRHRPAGSASTSSARCSIRWNSRRRTA